MSSEVVPAFARALWETCLRLDGIERYDKAATPALSDDALLERINRIIAAAETLPPNARLQQPDSIILQGRMSGRRSWPLHPERIGNEDSARSGTGDEDHSPSV